MPDNSTDASPGVPTGSPTAATDLASAGDSPAVTDVADETDPTPETDVTAEADATAVTEEADATAVTGEPGAAPRKRTHRRDWRLGGRTVARWRELTLGVAILSLGVAVIAGTAIITFVGAEWAALAAQLTLWAGLLVGIVWAFARSRPIGLLRISAADVVFGLALGILLRFAQGWVETATGGSGAFPSYPTIGGQLGSDFLLTEVISPVVIAPVLEELFFRAVVLVCVYTLLRRRFGKLMAGIAAGLVSTGLFVLLHSLTLVPTVGDVISLALLGLVCSALVLLTGRIWGAILTHVVYNGTFVLLALAGTLWG